MGYLIYYLEQRILGYCPGLLHGYHHWRIVYALDPQAQKMQAR